MVVLFEVLSASIRTITHEGKTNFRKGAYWEEMKYRFYHEWLYQIAKFVAQKCNSIATRCVSIMRKMADREKAWLDKLKHE